MRACVSYFCRLQGKDLFMDLDEGSLKLIDPENLTVINTQPIHTIRVWGVGRDNGRLALLNRIQCFLVHLHLFTALIFHSNAAISML